MRAVVYVVLWILSTIGSLGLVWLGLTAVVLTTGRRSERRTKRAAHDAYQLLWHRQRRQQHIWQLEDEVGIERSASFWHDASYNFVGNHGASPTHEQVRRAFGRPERDPSYEDTFLTANERRSNYIILPPATNEERAQAVRRSLQRKP